MFRRSFDLDLAHVGALPLLLASKDDFKTIFLWGSWYDFCTVDSRKAMQQKRRPLKRRIGTYKDSCLENETQRVNSIIKKLDRIKFTLS
jgi:hypothetical protein